MAAALHLGFFDKTGRGVPQDEIMQRYGVRGVPTVIFFNRKGVEEKDLRIEYMAGKTEFLVRMKKILGESGAAP
jgi:thioredoxin-related protein